MDLPLSPAGELLRNELLTATTMFSGDEMHERFLSAVNRCRVPPHEARVILDAGKHRTDLTLLFKLRAIRDIYGQIDVYGWSYEQMNECLTAWVAFMFLNEAVYRSMSSEQIMREVHGVIRIPDDILRALSDGRVKFHCPEIAETAQSLLDNHRVKSAVC